MKEDRCEWNRFFKDSILAEKPIESITVEDIESAFIAITKDYAINKKRFTSAKSVLNGIFKYYRIILHFNPVEDFDDSILRGRFKPNNNSLDNYFEGEDLAEVYAYLKHSNNIYDIAICFAMNTILRIGEIRGLKYEDYNPASNELSISRATRSHQEAYVHVDGNVSLGKKVHITESRLKGNRSEAIRKIPITKDAADLIEKAHLMNPNGEYIFMYEERQISEDTFNRHLKAACKAVGLTKTSLFLGHSSTSQTLQYIKPEFLDEDDKEAVVNALTPDKAKKALKIKIA